MSQQYSLRWNNHQPNFISMFTSLLNTQTLVDVTLAAEGKQLLAHKVVLSACSTYFQALFVDNPSSHPIVILKDVTFADLRTMVDFMYCGEVNVTEEQLPKVLDTAKLLKIKGLTEMPESTSLTRSQGTSEFHSQCDSLDSQRHSPIASPSNKRRRRRKSSTGSTCLNMVGDDRSDAGPPSVDAITLSSLPQQQRRIREYHEIRTIDNSQQTADHDNLGMESLAIDSANTSVLPQGGQWTMMEHSYPRYSNACIGGGLQPDHNMYMNNVINPHMDPDLSNYGQALGVAGPSPGLTCADMSQQNQLMTPPVKRRRTTNPQSEENFQRALEAVRFGGIGFCKAARMFGVNNRTLWLEFKKKGYPNTRPSIKNRIKREHTTPPPVMKEELQQIDQQMALMCQPHQLPPGFIDSTAHGFALQVLESLGAPSSPNSEVRQRRSKLLKRQPRVPEDGREVRKQTSDPLPPTSVMPKPTPTLQKYESYPQFIPKSIYTRKSTTRPDQEVALLIRTVTSNERPPSTTTTITSAAASLETTIASETSQTPRASHTPAVRSGPPLSCNFCWNTVDECGRILRRKTQYHCPECRTNLCIVPCFHEYHEGPDTEANTSAR